MLDKDAALRLYCENREHIRHHESERSLTFNIFLSALVALYVLYVASPIPLDADTRLYVLYFIMAISAYGFLFIEKLSERANLHIDRSHSILNALEGQEPGIAAITSIVKSSDQVHRQKNSVLCSVPLHYLWRGTFIVTLFVTTCLIARTLLQPPQAHTNHSVYKSPQILWQIPKRPPI